MEQGKVCGKGLDIPGKPFSSVNQNLKTFQGTQSNRVSQDRKRLYLMKKKITHKRAF